jgi:antirestriction protein
MNVMIEERGRRATEIDVGQGRIEISLHSYGREIESENDFVVRRSKQSGELDNFGLFSSDET